MAAEWGFNSGSRIARTPSTPTQSNAGTAFGSWKVCPIPTKRKTTSKNISGMYSLTAKNISGMYSLTAKNISGMYSLTARETRMLTEKEKSYEQLHLPNRRV